MFLGFFSRLLLLIMGGGVLFKVYSKLNSVCCLGKLIFVLLKLGYLLYMDEIVLVGLWIRKVWVKLFRNLGFYM